MSGLHARWEAVGYGVQLFARVLTRLAWADDTWLFAATRRQLERMMRDFATAAELEAGFDTDTRLEKCSVAFVTPAPSLPEDTEHVVASEAFPLLSRMSHAVDGTCLRLLGATLQVGRSYSG